MSGIRAKNTRPEISLRGALHRLGFRYRIHGRLPGKPDLVFPRRKAVVFVHGCFWHGHDCHLFRWPSTRRKFWREKIEGNRTRDGAVAGRLHEDGWRVLTVWECCFKGRTSWGPETLVASVSAWLTSGTGDLELRGK